MADKIKPIFPLQALTMESLESKGLFIDDLQKLRVMDPELEQQTSGLKEECGAFVTQMGDFQKMTDGFIALSDEVKLSCGIMQKKVLFASSKVLIGSQASCRLQYTLIMLFKFLN